MNPTFDFEGWDPLWKETEVFPKYGESYHLSTDGYFFDYLPIGRPRVEVCLYRIGNGSIPIDRVVIIESHMTKEKHYSLINRFEASIALGLY